MRTVNKRLMSELVRAQGDYAKESVSQGARVSSTTIFRLMCEGYGGQPREDTRRRLCEFFNVLEDDLFPLVDAKGRGRAS